MLQKPGHSYWIIIGLLLLATSLSFLDRQVLSVSILKIKEDLSISDIDYGFINSGSLASYAVMFTLGGILIDRYRSRLGLAFSVGFGSFATLLYSLSTSVFQFGLFRFLLGVGEGGCFPGAIKAVLERVPKSKHALANGIANILGGWLSDFVFNKTSNLDLARKLVMGIAALLTIPIVFVGFIHSYFIIIVLMTLAFFAHGLWITNYITSISAVFGKRVTSTVVGLSGSAGAVSAFVLNPLIGYVVTYYSYDPLWWYSWVMYPLAFLLLLKFIPRIEMTRYKLSLNSDNVK